MAGSATALLFLALTAVFLHTSNAIHCYACSSDVDRACGDPFNATSRRFLISDCDRERSLTSYLRVNPVCRKFVHKVNNDMIVVRSCAWGSDKSADGPCSPSSLNYAQKIESCSTCTTDECNSAPSITSMSMMIGFSLALLAARHF